MISKRWRCYIIKSVPLRCLQRNIPLCCGSPKIVDSLGFTENCESTGRGKSTGNVKSSGVKLSFTLRIDASLASYRREIDPKSSWVQFLITTWIDASLA